MCTRVCESFKFSSVIIFFSFLVNPLWFPVRDYTFRLFLFSFFIFKNQQKWRREEEFSLPDNTVRKKRIRHKSNPRIERNPKMKRSNFPLMLGGCDLLSDPKKEDTIPIVSPSSMETISTGSSLTSTSSSIFSSQRHSPSQPIYVIAGENAKSATKISSHPHIPPTKGSVILIYSRHLSISNQIPWWRSSFSVRSEASRRTCSQVEESILF